MKTLRFIVVPAFSWLLSLPVWGAEIEVQFQLPVIETVEYHRPYVAVWLEDTERRPVAQLALWLEQEKWHRDLRSWWRRGGKQLVLPIDGVSGATRKPGQHKVGKVVSIKPGQYYFNIEAAREVGGREHIRVPFEWNTESLLLEAQGHSELGRVTIRINQEK